ncbi:1-acyl-sn-glycerol-3-phosphate acyltransferase [bacterium]|nr:MAG: 1-acyl-sn-glycerol-3-phosphate acyltransferase [bacterium]
MLIVTIFWTISFGLAVILFSPFDYKKGRILGFIVKYWAKTIFKTMNINVRVIGLDKLDRNADYIFAPNHASSLDIPLILGFLPFWIVPISKIELKWIPFLGWAMQAAGHVFVDRRDHEKAMLSIAKIKNSLLKNPRSILIFPEGSRTNDGKVNQFKTGGLSIGISTKISIVPVAIEGTFDSLSKHSKKFVNKLLTINIGSPVDTRKYSLDDRKNLAIIVNSEVKKLKNELN